MCQKNMIKIQSKSGVETCKIRTAADGPHDKHEMPACAFRLVNTEVKSTSAVSKNVHVFLFSFVYGVRFCMFFGTNYVKKHDKNKLRISCQKKGQNEPKKDPKMRLNLRLISTKTDHVFQRPFWVG